MSRSEAYINDLKKITLVGVTGVGLIVGVQLVLYKTAWVVARILEWVTQ